MINGLTKEQEAKLPVYKEKWLSIGLNTTSDPIDMEAVEKAIEKAYAVADLPPPKKIIQCSNPKEGAIKAFQLEHNTDKVPTSSQIEQQLNQCGYGAHDANWLAFYDYMHKELNLECCAQLEGLINLAQLISWWWPFDEAVVVTPLPSFICRDEENRLHHDGRKALEYPDGWGIYSWHGVRVPEDLIIHPENITHQEILQEKNQELKRIKLERYGLTRWLDDVGAKEVAVDDRGTLVETNAMSSWTDEDEELAKFVVVKDSSTDRMYALRVPPDTKTPTEGIASTFGLTEDEYCPTQET
jgi:hypothetical protein